MKSILTGDRLGGVLYDIQQIRESRKQLISTYFQVTPSNERHLLFHRLILSDSHENPQRLRSDLINVAAFATAWAEAIDADEERKLMAQAAQSVEIDLPPLPKAEPPTVTNLAEAANPRIEWADGKVYKKSRCPDRGTQCFACDRLGYHLELDEEDESLAAWARRQVDRQLNHQLNGVLPPCTCDTPGDEPCARHDRREAPR